MSFHSDNDSIRLNKKSIDLVIFKKK